MTPESLTLIRMAVREAARDAWNALRTAHPDDTFYYFGLWTTPLAHRPAPTAASIEGLDRAVAELRADGVERRPEELRWSVNDSPYDLYGDEHFRPVAALFEEFGYPVRPPARDRRGPPRLSQRGALRPGRRGVLRQRRAAERRRAQPQLPRRGHSRRADRPGPIAQPRERAGPLRTRPRDALTGPGIR
ncbi:DUF4303 domain-containing protein [Leifsonia xyli]|uniref:DUF4303 domain-containing protein n=1 Tax=Leifsonia xyli TaxID=1575 RepID=UPI001F4724A7|nr:DUF4303 domain-containing protein [Leifsonia xyli]